MVDYLAVVFVAASRIGSDEIAGTIAHRAASSSKRSARAAGLSYTHAALCWRTSADVGDSFCEASAVHPDGVRVFVEEDKKRRYNRERAEEVNKRTYHFVKVVNPPVGALSIAKAFSKAQVGQPYAWLPSYLNFTPILSTLLPMGLTLADAREWESALERAPLVTITELPRAQTDDSDDDDVDEKDALLPAAVLNASDLFAPAEDEWEQASGTGAETLIPVIVKPWICSEFVLAALLCMRVLHADDFGKHPCLYSPDETQALLLDLGKERFVFDNPL